MRVSIGQWGNSAAIRIPQGILSDLGVKVGQHFEMRIERDVLILEPVRQRFELQSLLAQITPANLHEEIDWGPARGSELW